MQNASTIVNGTERNGTEQNRTERKWEMKILIIESDNSLAGELTAYLKFNGFQIEAIYSGISGVELAQGGNYDLLIVDVTKPGLDSCEVTKRIRLKRIGIPILMLGTGSDVEDRINGLDCGADYYVTKPFDNRELLSCIKALLRQQREPDEAMCYGNTSLHVSSGTLSCGENSVRLTSRELDVMRLLFQSGRNNVSKEAILIRVWGYDSNAVKNNVELYAGFLRKKLKSIGSNLSIVAARKMGYHLEVMSA